MSKFISSYTNPYPPRKKTKKKFSVRDIRKILSKWFDFKTNPPKT